MKSTFTAEGQIEKISDLIAQLRVDQPQMEKVSSSQQAGLDRLIAELTALVEMLTAAAHPAETSPQAPLQPEAQEAERKYEFIVNTSKELMTLIDRHYVYEAVNEAYCRARNKPRTEIIGRTVAQVWGEDRFHRIVKAKLDETFAGNEVHYQDWFEFHTLGLRCFDVAYYPYSNAVGLVTHVVVVSRDVTDRQQAEAAHQEIEERYRRFFEEDLAGDFIATPAGQLVACNPAFARIFGFPSAQEAMQHKLADLFPVEADWQAFHKRLLAERKVEYHEMELRHHGGQAIYVLANVVGAFDQAGELYEVKGYLFDNTGRKELEEQFRQSQKMEALGSLAGGIAHDFNNLTTIITGYSELLLRSLDENNPLVQDIGEIKRAGEQAALLTRQLLAFSRKQLLRPRTLNLNDVVIELERMLRRLIGEDIELSVPRSEVIGYVKVDRSQIEQIILNLVVNARDAMPNGGKLTLRTENVVLDEDDARQQVEVKPGAYACLMVEDTGSGMDPETQKHIFEPFFTTKEPGKGTGLGLSSVYGTLKQSGGHITVSSQPGQGAMFKIYLPMVEEEEPPAIGNREAPTTLYGSETILLVEDEKGVRTVVRKLLEQYGYHVLEVHNADQALRLFATYDEPIQLVISDVVLPGGMSGYHLAERLTAIYPQTKALLISGYIDKAHPSASALYSKIPFLQKPFALKTFIRTVRGVLDRSVEA